ncbi:hypothetical protein J7943_13295 [Vibrio parahaemolyticus]|uniref:hypothetical protein n=1 Tax=Vibrio parahaemolyticus TaxID=670 RepID=UPI001E102033|nr:hypothetical protein [Vibrio cholerae]EJG1943827.1 hypothetical protein [Vibrio parahaemolyticus]EJG1955988.1 hypothetical protein [Vibrio parahaemolyticus]ELJ8600120.1 hypothetical protein [Vibrio cholerae]MCF9522279.1 hypothetical protein [Vibrio parahaemolyticus]
MQNKKLEQALQDITYSINTELKLQNPNYEEMTTEYMLFYVNAHCVDMQFVPISVDQAGMLSDTSQNQYFVLGMLIKAYSEQNIYQSILFKSYESALNHFSVFERNHAQKLVEMCTDNRFGNSETMLYTTLSVTVNHFADDFIEPLHVQLLEEAKLVCLTKMFLAIQDQKQELKLVS